MIFPNILSLFYNFDINLPHSKKNQFVPGYNSESRFKDNADVWLFNIKTMHAISLILGAEFFVFLQPTLGLEGAQSNFIGQNSRDEELLLDLLKNETYLNNLRNTYSKLKKHCLEITYCFDISDVALPSTKNVYSNNRHHNERGNEIIANKIFKIINQRN